MNLSETTPAYLKDTPELLTEQGFTTSNVWYHGTSSALLDSILAQGLQRSGDRVLNQAHQQTMATIGGDYKKSFEPIFLTPSKELAYYWAQQRVRERSVRIQGEESPVVLAVTLPEELNQQVKPDVGAASLLMVEEGEHYLAQLASLYEAQNLAAPDIDLRSADRMAYLQQLGMAYYDANIDSSFIALLEE